MKELVIIGGGPGGLSAAVAARKAGIKDVLIIERGQMLGGVLQQCIHNGFGLHKMGEELTGPEYAERYVKQVEDLKIPYKLNTMVLSVSKDKVVTTTNATEGIKKIKAKAVIFAMGCRERAKGALNIAGERPSGIYSAGTAQRLVNIDGYMPGKKVVILGSGDIGLIMARRMTLEGAEVKAVLEVMSYSGGLNRNVEQCLNDFNIPLKLSHTVTKIHGKERIEGVTVSRVDQNRNIIDGTDQYIECDTLLLSVGLIPENELTKGAGVDIDRVTNGAIVDQDRETSVDGIFACGNVLHVHDLVDYVSEEGEIAGVAAAKYLLKKSKKNADIKIIADGKIRYTVPQKISKIKDVLVYFRVSNVYKNVKINVYADDKLILSKSKVKLLPSQMESVKIQKSLLEGVNSLKFTLEEK